MILLGLYVFRAALQEAVQIVNVPALFHRPGVVQILRQTERLHHRRQRVAHDLLDFGFGHGRVRVGNFLDDARLKQHLFDSALGSFSPFYSKFYDEGLINDTFSASVFRGRGFFLPIVSGDSRDPDRICEEVKKELQRLKRDGIPKDDFEVVKKMTYGDLVGSFNNVGSVAKGMMNADLAGTDIFDSIETAAAVTYDDVAQALEGLDTENSSLSIIEPLDRQ